MTVTEIERYNRTYEQYTGKNVRGSGVVALLEKVIDNNFCMREENDNLICINFKNDMNITDVDKLKSIIKKIKTSKKYTIECKYSNINESIPKVNEITITEYNEETGKKSKNFSQ